MAIKQRALRILYGSPILWGGLLGFAFYGLVHGELIRAPLVVRYFASHPVEYVMTFMFLAGMAALTSKGLDVWGQKGRLRRGPILDRPTAEREPVAEVDRMLERVDGVTGERQDDYHVRRLRAVLEHVQHKGSASGLDEELKYWADQDAATAYADYGFVRTVTWSIPILGFLGTVIGIAVAMGSLNPEDLAKSLPIVMSGLTIAFDTTALALALSIVLVFFQYAVDRQETRLLAEVDRKAGAELLGRFEQIESQGSGEMSVVKAALDRVVESTEQLVRRQAEIWSKSLDAANERFANAAAEASSLVASSLAPAMTEAVKVHAAEMTAADRKMQETVGRQMDDWRESMDAQLEMLVKMQAAMGEQATLLQGVVEATGQVATLEERLNQNLAALSGAGDFEQTVNSLAATIHLLNNRLSASGDGTQVRLGGDKNKGHAA